MKGISVLGSTGSVGRQTLDVIREHNTEFRVVALSANRNIELIKQQIEEFRPLAVAIMDEGKAAELCEQVDIPVYTGMEGLIKIATIKQADIVVTSVVGSVGIKPTAEAIKAGKAIALANKETLVSAGEYIMGLVKKYNTHLTPIDSEHSAILQCLNGENRSEVEKIIITCSGGSFLGRKREDLENVDVGAALNHPTWSMGRKITIDSATLMNKGFEVLEAMHLYDIPLSQIEVVVHPQSIIHSMVEYKDGSVIAQLGEKDMRLPIQYSLSFPRRPSNSFKKLNLAETGKLTFEKPDTITFPCLTYAYEAGETGGTLPAVMNAANEVAVDAFLKGKIKFLDIPRIIKGTMDLHSNTDSPDIDEILSADEWARKKASELVGGV